LKILFANYSEITSPGGVHKTIREIAKNLSNKGHEVIVLQANPSRLSENEFLDGYRCIRMNLPYAKYFYGFDPRMKIYLENYLMDIVPDIIHVHGYHSLFSLEMIILLKLIFRLNLPIVFSPHYGGKSHNSFAGKYLWNIYNFFGSNIFNLINKTICASEYEKNTLKKELSINGNNILVIPHGVDELEMVKRERSDQIHLLYAGYLLELKGIQYIIKTVYELKSQFNRDVLLTIIGDGYYKPSLVKLSNELSLQDSINWYHFMSGKEYYNKLKEADILLLLSKSENYGIVAAESLALGIPVIVSNTTALSEFITEPGCFGIDFPPDPKKVAELVIRIKEGDMEVGPFSDKIRKWIKVSDDYERIYLDLLKQEKIKNDRSISD
jgi:glycogen synthase